MGEHAARVSGVAVGIGSFGVHLEGSVVPGEKSFHAERRRGYEKYIAGLEGVARREKEDGACRSRFVCEVMGMCVPR